jgi:glycosyltransferase involved in cell wall biosynthesis
MPSYNHGKFIGQSIQSVVSQTLGGWELVIVDDGSKDDSRKTIERWEHLDDRINVIFHKENEGIGKTFNDGIRAAKGEYVAFVASDDMLNKDALRVACRSFDEDADYGAAILEAEIIDVTNKALGIMFSDLFRKPVLHRGFFFDDLINGNFVCTGVVRRAVIEERSIYYDEDLKYLNDWLFWLDLSRACSFIYIDEPLYCYRVHSGNTVERDLLGHAADWQILPDKIFERHGRVLSAKSKGSLLRRAGEMRASVCDFESARGFLYRSLVLDPDPAGRLRSALTILLTYVPSIYCLSRKLWRLARGFKDSSMIRRE